MGLQVLSLAHWGFRAYHGNRAVRWRNWLARQTNNLKAVGSIPIRTKVALFFLLILTATFFPITFWVLVIACSASAVPREANLTGALKQDLDRHLNVNMTQVSRV